MTHYRDIHMPCNDCHQELVVEFQPASFPSQYALYTDGEKIGYATLHCENCDCGLEWASIEAAAYPTLPEAEFQQWREWVKQHRERIAS